MKRDLSEAFMNQIFSEAPEKNYPINKIIYNHIDEIYSIDLADMIDYKISNKQGFRYILVIRDNFSKNLWARPLKNKNSQTVTSQFSNFLSSSKQSPAKIESDRGKEWYISIFQNFLKLKIRHHCSRFTDKGPSIVERVIRTIRNFLIKPLFDKGNADWLSELPTAIKQNNSPEY